MGFRFISNFRNNKKDNEKEMTKKLNQYQLEPGQILRLQKWHTFEPDDYNREVLGLLNFKILELAEFILKNTPGGRVQALALTHLEACYLSAHQAMDMDDKTKRLESKT